ncbi:transcriptional repressor NF-X1-like [Watersipora subatra]|uniref:transcriptional repressor NF-X1-like n=1 Tax=Watersipora subatra TaxID=2589382 RepID=UPI00355C8C1A
MKGNLVILSFLIWYVAGESEPCSLPECSNPCESPGIRERDVTGCPTCKCLCPVLEDCAIIECPEGQVPYTQDSSMTGCERCLCVDGKNKPGICPVTPTSPGGACQVDCTWDKDCAGNYKCCGLCPRLCVASLEITFEKPGECPQKEDNSSICESKCNEDSDCPREEKCCGSCMRECISVQSQVGLSRQHRRRDQGSSQQCPARMQRVKECKTARSHRCDTDDDCRRGKICCGFCRRRCVRGRFRRRMRN